jgi:3,4-dihydroxy 2-butanone 4-phosphate synthase/GTP cyclohydrolase II
MPQPPFIDVPGAIAEIQAGRMIVVVDDEDRENEGDLTLAAEFVTPEAINFMARYGRGLICLTLTEERADYLRLPPMSQENTSRFGTAFTESIEAREGVTTGISAADRAHTIRVAIDSTSSAADLARPGHVFPLRARKGGVLVRAGQTEASVDLARMAGLIPAGVICEIMNDDGTMARVPDLERFCTTHGLKMLTVAEMIRYRLRHERYIHRVARSPLHTRYGDFTMIAYESEVTGGESHLALVRGPVGLESDTGNAGDTPTLVRVHSHCLAGDVFGAASWSICTTTARVLKSTGANRRHAFCCTAKPARGRCIPIQSMKSAISGCCARWVSAARSWRISISARSGCLPTHPRTCPHWKASTWRSWSRSRFWMKPPRRFRRAPAEPNRNAIPKDGVSSNRA